MSFESRKRPRKLEKMLDESSTAIEVHLRTLVEAQREMEGAMDGRTALLVDTTLNNPRGLLEASARKLHDRGWEELATLYIEKLFGGRLPEHTGEMFQQFLGPNVHLVHHDIREARPPTSENIDAVFFSGSPADVSKGLAQPDAEVRPGITHGQVYARSRSLYREAAQQNLPVVAVCYGHDMITQEHGGTVVRDSAHANVGMEGIEASVGGGELLAGVLGFERPMQGRIGAFHSEAVQHNPSRSALLLHTSDRDPAIVHGLMHIAGEANGASGEFSGDAAHDIELVQSLLADRKHLALTVQGHPEYTGAGPFLAFSAKEDPSMFEETNGHVLTADMLQLFSSFLDRYGKK